MLRHRHKRDALGIEDFDDLGEVGERAGQSVDFVHHYDVDFAGANFGQEMLQCRAIEITTRPPPIIIVLRQARPALMTLTSDERLARLPLGLQRVELLLQALF